MRNRRKPRDFAIGEVVDVCHKVNIPGSNRTQIFSGVVIDRTGDGSHRIFTVRRNPELRRDGLNTAPSSEIVKVDVCNLFRRVSITFK